MAAEIDVVPLSDAAPAVDPAEDKAATTTVEPEGGVVAAPKRKPGRPRKEKPPTDPEVPKRKPGRPKKEVTAPPPAVKSTPVVKTSPEPEMILRSDLERSMIEWLRSRQQSNVERKREIYRNLLA